MDNLNAPTFLLGMATSWGLIVAIGAQNAFVLRQGLARAHVLPVVLVCALSDALLITLGILLLLAGASGGPADPPGTLVVSVVGADDSQFCRFRYAAPFVPGDAPWISDLVVSGC